MNSVFRFDRAGIVPNSGGYELCHPQRRTTIIGNTVYSNNQSDTPAIDVAILAMGNGILSAGGIRNPSSATSCPTTTRPASAWCRSSGRIPTTICPRPTSGTPTARPGAQDYRTAPTPEPGDQPNMPDAATAPASPATDVPFIVDLASISRRSRCRPGRDGANDQQRRRRRAVRVGELLR